LGSSILRIRILCWRDVLNLSRDLVHITRLLLHQFYLCATSSIRLWPLCFKARTTHLIFLLRSIDGRLGDNPRFCVSIRISAWIIRYRMYRSLISYRPFLSPSFISLLPFPSSSYDSFSIKILLKYRFYLKQTRPSLSQLHQN
jgi:hypothetical protein